MLSELGQRQLKEGAYGGTKLQLNLEDIRALVVLRPPLVEQQAIVDSLRTELRSMNMLLELARATISTLRERRQALISAAVTGKIDVRGL
jgi:type I restriction enzyme S subunit